MTTRQFNERCDQLRAAILSNRDTGPFKVVRVNGTRYIYNALAHNIIYKERMGRRNIGVQYRPTSVYAEVMKETVRRPRSLVTASPNMRRHVRDVQARTGR